MTDEQKVLYLLAVIREARQKVLDGKLQEVWSALYVPAEIERAVIAEEERRG